MDEDVRLNSDPRVLPRSLPAIEPVDAGGGTMGTDDSPQGTTLGGEEGTNVPGTRPSSKIWSVTDHAAILEGFYYQYHI